MDDALDEVNAIAFYGLFDQLVCKVGLSLLFMRAQLFFEILVLCLKGDDPFGNLFRLAGEVLGERGEPIFFDVTKKNQIEKAYTQIAQKTQRVEILINNAGITGPTATLWEYDIEMWKKVVDINLMGTFNCCRTIVPNMIKNNYGRIVNVASVAGKDGNANASAYSVGKAGVIGLTKSLGKELANKNIAVNAVTPAGAKTRILDQMTKEHVQRMLSKVPRGRFLEVEEFTSLVCWLSSEENTFSTAAVFDISGGRSTY